MTCHYSKTEHARAAVHISQSLTVFIAVVSILLRNYSLTKLGIKGDVTSTEILKSIKWAPLVSQRKSFNRGFNFAYNELNNYILQSPQ